MAGLFSSSEQDILGNILRERNAANTALGSPYGKYAGIVSSGGMLADIMADAGAGGMTGASDPRMMQAAEVKNIYTQVAQMTGETKSPTFYRTLAQALGAKFPEQAQKALDKAAEVEKQEAALASTKALTDSRKAAKDRSTVSERNRNTIVELETKLQAGEQLTPREVANARYLLAQESKPKSWTDPETKEVVTIQPFDVNAAAPNLAAFLGKGAPAGGVAGEATVTATPASKKLEEKNIKSLEGSLGELEGDLRNINKAEELIGFFTTGRVGAALDFVDPGSEARALEEAIGSIKAATAFGQLRALREASKSGSSGLGQVTEVEFKALQDRMTSLRKESPTFKKDLAYIKAKWNELKQRAMNDLAALKGEKIPYPNVERVGESYSKAGATQQSGGLKPLEVGGQTKIGNVTVVRVE